ncbi:MAG: hypothetical protein P8I03_10630 [Thalassotalea sp.]|nr:hypothetical protein [Thalassotalea sp.]
MKNIKLTLLLILLSLSLGISQLNAFEVNNSKRILTRSDMHKCINQVIDVLANEYIFPEKSKILATQLKKELISKKFNKRVEVGTFALKLAIFMRQVSGDNYLDVTEARPQISIGKKKYTDEPSDINDYGFTKIDIL